MLAERGLDWTGVTITLNDDRRVPEDHPASNHGKLRAALPDVTIERLNEAAKVLPFDLVWLGMGGDGHVASLFPHMRAELLPGPRVIATTPIPLPAEAPFDRLSLNWRALLATREVILVVTGEAKRRVIEAALARTGLGPDLPVATLFAGAGILNPPPVTIYWSA
jgi:6-phosphogluconolactonase